MFAQNFCLPKFAVELRLGSKLIMISLFFFNRTSKLIFIELEEPAGLAGPAFALYSTNRIRNILYKPSKRKLASHSSELVPRSQQISSKLLQLTL